MNDSTGNKLRQWLILSLCLVTLALFAGAAACTAHTPFEAAPSITPPPNSSPTQTQQTQQVKPPDKRYYFAYGSNMDPMQMSLRCPGAVFSSIARVDGYRFIINVDGVATVVPEPGGTVYGILWAITETDEQALDKYEGVEFGIYKKERLDIKITRGESVSALSYMANNSSPGLPKHSYYLKRILLAAEQLALPQKYINEIRGWLGTSD